MATASLNPVATLPKASSARTFTAGVICWPATVVLGCVPNTSWVAAPGVILKPLLVAGVRPAAVAGSASAVAVLLARSEERGGGVTGRHGVGPRGVSSAE